jgi:hypothetical protein
MASTATTTVESTQESIKFKPGGGKRADLALNSNYEKYEKMSTNEEYKHAVSSIESKLDNMGSINALFTVNLGSNQPDVLIDARHAPATLSTLASDRDPPSDVEGALYVRPHMIQRWVDGIMEARYSLSYGHILITPGTPTRIGIKFIDCLGPFGWQHPTLDKDIVPKLPQPTTDVNQVKKDLKDFGFGLLKDAISGDELKRLQTRLKEQAQGEADTGVGFFDGGETKPNQRVWNLPNKGQEFIDLLDHNPTFETFVPEFLGEDAYLFSYTANIARPGNTPMNLHTDQITIQPPIRHVAFGLNFMFFLEDVTPEIGGTLVMPASHKDMLAPDDPYDAHTDTVSAHGPAGTCMIFESRIWHATGSNTVLGSERPVIIVFFMRSFVRQQENWALSIRDDVLETLSDKVKGYLGFRCVGTMGGTEGKTKDGAIVGKVQNPIGILRPKVEGKL